VLVPVRTSWIAATASSTSPARVVNRRDTVGSEATNPKIVGCARTAAMSARQSPPSATAVATSSRILPGSWRAPSGRHGANAADSPRSKPATRTDSRSSSAPDDEISDSRASSRTMDGAGLSFSPAECLPLELLGLSQEQESQAGQALPCVQGPCRPIPREIPRLAALRSSNSERIDGGLA
jgi:hypothetical protein